MLAAVSATEPHHDKTTDDSQDPRQLWLPRPWARPRTSLVLFRVVTTRSRLHRQARPPWTQLEFPVVRMWDFQKEGHRRRQCSPFPRARTVNVAKLGVRLKQGAHTHDLFDVGVEALRPRTRAECAPPPGKRRTEPCPWIGCRHHTAITVDPERGSIKETFPQLRILDDPEGPGLHVLEELVGTCSLDACDGLDDGTGGIGGLIALYQAASSGKPVGQTPGMTIAETGHKLNLSIERTRQLSAQALQEMRVKLMAIERLY